MHTVSYAIVQWLCAAIAKLFALSLPRAGDKKAAAEAETDAQGTDVCNGRYGLW